jgi:hypothetical protein
VTYSVVSHTRSGLPLVAFATPHGSALSPRAASCCICQGGTLNPKVEGSNPSRPMRDALVLAPFRWGLPFCGCLQRGAFRRAMMREGSLGVGWCDAISRGQRNKRGMEANNVDLATDLDRRAGRSCVGRIRLQPALSTGWGPGRASAVTLVVLRDNKPCLLIRDPAAS